MERNIADARRAAICATSRDVGGGMMLWRLLPKLSKGYKNALQHSSKERTKMVAFA
jgi:hypothetical protein